MDEGLNLSEAPAGKKLKIIKIYAGTQSRRRLLTMGIHTEDIIIRLGNSKWGPVLLQNISNNVSKIAIGRGLAEKIFVELEIS